MALLSAALPFVLPTLVHVLAAGIDPTTSPAQGIVIGVGFMLRVVSDTFCVYFPATNRAAFLNAYVPIQAVLSVGCQWFLGTRYGILGILSGLCLSFLLTSAWILPFFSLRDLGRHSVEPST